MYCIKNIFSQYSFVAGLHFEWDWPKFSFTEAGKEAQKKWPDSRAWEGPSREKLHEQAHRLSYWLWTEVDKTWPRVDALKWKVGEKGNSAEWLSVGEEINDNEDKKGVEVWNQIWGIMIEWIDDPELTLTIQEAQTSLSDAHEDSIDEETFVNLFTIVHEWMDLSELSPDDIISFADDIQHLHELTRRIDGLEMPTNLEEYQALLERVKQYRWEDWKLHIPMTEKELVDLWITVENWEITLWDWTKYPWNEAPPWMPRLQGDQVVSWSRWRVWKISWWPSIRFSDAELANLPPWVDWLMSFIWHAEWTGDNYNAMFWNWSQSKYDFTQMTLTQVREFQRWMVVRNWVSSAIWKYQIMWYTLDDYVQRYNISMDTKFDKDFQDTFAKRKLWERWLNRFLAWTMWIDQFQVSLAREWASIPKDASWRSYYAGDGINDATVSHAQVRHQLERLKTSWSQPSVA